jgi:hypothetical protein
MSRKPFPESVQTEVLVKCRRRCAFCYLIDQDADEKEGQVAHIDRNPENNAKENAAWLCTKHHARYDTRSRQTKGYSPDELRKYQQILYASVESFETWASKKRSRSKPGSRAGRRAGMSQEVYNRRIPIYHKTMHFVRDLLKNLRPELQLILKFADDTDEALFLFEESVAQYLADLFKRAMRLYTLNLMRTRMQTEGRDAERFAALLVETRKIVHWFDEQPEEIRARFAPFLRLT